MRRWISWERPLVVERRTRSGEEPGSMAYSAVTQPDPRPFNQRGMSSSTDTVHTTRVRPKVTSTDPAVISV
jgi:hypothetical protein